MKKNQEIAIEMTRDLLKMGTDTYNLSKYMLLIVSRKRNGANRFVRTLFSLADEHRRLCIGMKGGAESEN